MLGAALLARTWRHTRKPEYLALADAAMEYSCTRQLADGAWWYGEEPRSTTGSTTSIPATTSTA